MNCFASASGVVCNFLFRIPREPQPQDFQIVCFLIPSVKHGVMNGGTLALNGWPLTSSGNLGTSATIERHGKG